MTSRALEGVLAGAVAVLVMAIPTSATGGLAIILFVVSLGALVVLSAREYRAKRRWTVGH